jgi:2-oxo-4-hydroxy-4-carboxy-5-ureidoimidazoline decarboxylase
MTAAHEVLNATADDEAKAMLLRCCGSSRWVQGMLERRPFATHEALASAADEVWARLSRQDYLEAFGHHPRIGRQIGAPAGVQRATADWSREEQAASSGADASTAEALRRANDAYERRFGFVFLICATGKTAPQVLSALETRIGNDAETELRIAAAEQANITRMRLEKLP